MPLDPLAYSQAQQAAQQSGQAASPLEQYGRVLALKNALQQGQLGQQQLQEGAINLQQKQQLLKDQQTFSAVMTDPAVAGDINKALPILSQRTSPQFYVPLSKSLLDNGKTIADTRKAQSDADEANQKVQESQQGLVSDMIQGLGPNATAHDLQAHANLLLATSQNLAPKIQPVIQQMIQAPDPDAFARQIVQSAMGAKAQAQKATTAEQTAGAAQKQAEADKANFELNLEKNGAAAGESSIDGLIPPDKFPAANAQAHAAYKDQIGQPDGISKAKKAVMDIFDAQLNKPAGAAATVTAETPAKVNQQAALLPGQVRQAGAEAAATEPIRARANADAQAYLMKQVGGPLQNVMDPGERARISGDYMKANDAYAEKAADAKKLLDFVAAARTGNQSAAGLLPVAEVRSLVQRVNTQELNAAGGGSAMRRLANLSDKEI